MADRENNLHELLDTVIKERWEKGLTIKCKNVWLPMRKKLLSFEQNLGDVKIAEAPTLKSFCFFFHLLTDDQISAYISEMKYHNYLHYLRYSICYPHLHYHLKLMVIKRIKLLINIYYFL